MEYEIVTYGNVRLLANVLQSIALMMGKSDDFIGMMATAVAIGFLVALLTYAVAPRKLAGWYWLGSVAAVTGLMVLPKATVQVIDRLPGCGVGGNCVTVVEEVPAGLALVASVTSRIGDRLTELFETNFANFGPLDSPELAYRRNGLMFGNKVLRESANTHFADPEFHHDMVTYLDRCVAQDLADGTIKAGDLSRSKDIWNTLRAGGIGGNPAIFVPLASGETMSCRLLQETLGKPDKMGAQEQAALARLGHRLNANAPVPPSNDTHAASIASGQATQIFLRTQLGEASHSAADTIRQHAFINAMRDANTMRSQRTGDATPVMLGLGEEQAKISTNAGWITGAKVAEEAMPLIRNGIEAVLYAAFPIIVLMTLVVSGKTAVKLGTSYAAVLLWIQLWPPLYAVLNFMATETSVRHVVASGGSTNGNVGLTLLTSESIYENVISDMAVVGYLVTFIPVIAWSLVKGMESIAGGAIAGATAFTSGAREAGGLAGTASHSIGAVSHDQVNLSPSYRAANFSTFENGYLSRTDDMSSRDLDTWQAKQSNTGINASAVRQMGASKSQAASEQLSIGKSEAIAAERSLSSAFNSAKSFVTSHSDSYTQSTTDGKNLAAAIGDSTRIRNAFGFSGGTGANTTNGNTAGSSFRQATSKQETVKYNEAHGVNTQSGLNVSGGGEAPPAPAAPPARGGRGRGGQRPAPAPVPPTGGTGPGVNASVAATSQYQLSQEEAYAQQQAFEHGGAEQVASGTSASWAADGSQQTAADATKSVLDTVVHSTAFVRAVQDGDTLALSIQRSYNEAESWKRSSESHLQEGRSLQAQASFMESQAESIAASYNNYGARRIQEMGGMDAFVDALSHDPGAAGRMMSDATGFFRRSPEQLTASLQTDRLNDSVVSDLRGSAFSNAPTADRIMAGEGPGGARLREGPNGRPQAAPSGVPQPGAVGGSGKGKGRGKGGGKGRGSAAPTPIDKGAQLRDELANRSANLYDDKQSIDNQANSTRNEASLEVMSGRVETADKKVDNSKPYSSAP